MHISQYVHPQKTPPRQPLPSIRHVAGSTSKRTLPSNPSLSSLNLGRCGLLARNHAPSLAIAQHGGTQVLDAPGLGPLGRCLPW